MIDKKIIKNGMYFKYRNKYYIKIGKRCAEIDVDSSILFNEIETEEIKLIFNSNGTLKMCREKVYDYEEMPEYEEIPEDD